MKTTVILIGMIVILSLASPALAGGADEDERPWDEAPDDAQELVDRAQGVTGLPLPSAGSSQFPYDPEVPSPGLPDLPSAPAPGGGTGGDDESEEGEGGSGGSNPIDDPVRMIPCFVAKERTGCTDPETPESPAPDPEDVGPQPSTPPTTPGIPDPAEGVQKRVETQVAVVQKESDNLITAILAPVQAVAATATAGAKVVLSGVVTTAGFVAEEASDQAHGHATQALGLATGTIGYLEHLISSVLFADATDGDGVQGPAFATSAVDAAAVEGPVGTITLALVAVGSIGLIALAFVGARKLLGLGGLALLSRIPSKDIMKNDTRAAIFDIVTSDPGVSLNEIVDRLGLSRNAVAYHLAVFESEHQVVSVKDGKYRRYFVNGGKYVNGAKDVVSTIKNEVTRNVVRFILENPGAMQKEVCTAVGTSPSATNWHITRLEKVGLVEKEKVANTVRYSPGPSFNKYDLQEFGLHGAPQAAGVA